jgi:hypothetical protein
MGTMIKESLGNMCGNDSRKPRLVNMRGLGNPGN